jgi:hypothetical protein
MLAIVVAVTFVVVAPLQGGGQGNGPAPPPGGAKQGEQREEKRPSRGDEEKSGAPAFVVDDGAAAGRRLRESEKGLIDPEPRRRAQALEPFLVHRHELYVKRLAAMLKDKHEEVASTAARALANQPFAATTEALLDYGCAEKNVVSRPAVCAAAIRAVGAVGLGKKGYDRLRPVFELGDKEVKGAVCDAFAAAKEKRAFSFFVDRFDAPAPEDPNNAANPPEAYWRERHEEWSAYQQHVRKGLRELTGAKHESAKEWKEWAAGPGKKLGFAYVKGG